MACDTGSTGNEGFRTTSADHKLTCLCHFVGCAVADIIQISAFPVCSTVPLPKTFGPVRFHSEQRATFFVKSLWEEKALATFIVYTDLQSLLVVLEAPGSWESPASHGLFKGGSRFTLGFVFGPCLGLFLWDLVCLVLPRAALCTTIPMSGKT